MAYPVKDEALKYNTLYAKGYSHGPVDRTMKWALPRIILGDFSIIDLGCGLATVRSYFTDYTSYRGIDIADQQIEKNKKNASPKDTFVRGNISNLSEYKDKQFDLGICIDVLEHIPTEFAEEAVREICRISENLIVSISLMDSRHKDHNNQQLHLTVKPAEWWLNIFKKYIEIADHGSTGNSNLVLVTGPAACKKAPDNQFLQHARRGRLMLDGTFMLPRKNKDLEKLFDKLYDRFPNERRWAPRVERKHSLNALPKVNGPVVIIGKGPSLDDLTLGFFKSLRADTPVICINESIFKVENLDPLNPIFVIQHDSINCCPKFAKTMPILEFGVRNKYPHIQERYIYFKHRLKIPVGLTVLAAIRMAVEYMKATELIMVSFDASTHDDIGYAAIIGYDVKPLRGGTGGERFLTHKAHILNVAGDTPITWATPTPDGAVVYTPPRLQDNLEEHHEPVLKEPSAPLLTSLD